MEPSTSSSYQKTARYYNGLGFGINVYLRSHIDQDFTMSIVQAHTNNHDYQVNNKILCYFAFPRIGMAVALRPGDFLLFNPQEPHSISSHCRSEDEIFCISSYLKTGVVGLNDNSNTIG
jgi:ectoine hydroxylase-related dioxygenase (phytanoyl-CoA dioxygenase family)